MSNLEATIIVEFNGGAPDNTDYIANIRLDDVSNEDKSTFLPGEEPVFQGNFSSNVQVTDVVAIEGSVRGIGGGFRAEKFDTILTSRNPEELSEYKLPIVPSSTELTYLGRPGSVATSISPAGIVTYEANPEYTPFRMFVDTEYAVSLYRLTPPELSLEDSETRIITVVFYLELV